MWTAADAYERFMGGWSRRVAASFLDGLGVGSQAAWLDVGCGVGSVTAVILERCAPSQVVGVDQSPDFLQVARGQQLPPPGASFERASAEDLPFANATFDVTVSALVLNFVPDPALAVKEMGRVTHRGGTVAAYVWDYDHPDFFLTRFWEAVATVDGVEAPTSERGRWRICSEEGIKELVERSPLRDKRVWSVEIETAFPSPDELWEGFLLGVGPSGSWTVGLTRERQEELRTLYQERLPVAEDGSVRLTARALAFAGSAP